MERTSTKAVAAEVSAHIGGSLYVGVEAIRKLSVGLDDNIKVEIPALGRVVTGSLSSSHQIQIGKEMAEEVFDKSDDTKGQTAHIDAIVKPRTGTWDDDHGLTEERHEKVYHLDSKDL